MKVIDAINTFDIGDSQGVYLYSVRDLEKVLGESGDALRSTIRRCLSSGVITRVARNLYAYARSRNFSAITIYEIAARLRRGEYVFEALESAANHWGILTQVTLGGVNLLTTGRTARFDTPYGSVEFVHTQEGPATIAANTIERPNNPIPIATKEYTIKSLRRHRRSRDLIAEAYLMGDIDDEQD